MLSNSAIKRPRLEICTGDPAGVIAAKEGGADRVELCSGLAEGGLTPSLAIISFASNLVPVNVLVRPRGGDFVYTPEEVEVMEEDIRAAVKAGAKGIVVGALTPDGEVDVETCKRLLEAAPGCDSTFHRAFDLVRDPQKALEEIIALGFKRVLSSGQAVNAMEGSTLLRELHEQAQGRILIMAGAGVTPENANEILRLSEADEIHASARSLKPGAMTVSGTATMGTADAADGSRLATDADVVRKILNSISKR